MACQFCGYDADYQAIEVSWPKYASEPSTVTLVPMVGTEEPEEATLCERCYAGLVIETVKGLSGPHRRAVYGRLDLPLRPTIED